ncbi:ArsR/SmtB family transcription factor [Pseudonocardia alaniniphila]|uniref:ArsR/SmtB family transcription factor n=1 Tax=Pseudonocardia alaniniphila TaxID=75291 RepID=UPI0031D6FF16
MTPSAVSQHLRVLRDAGLFTGERHGRAVLYLTARKLTNPLTHLAAALFAEPNPSVSKAVLHA